MVLYITFPKASGITAPNIHIKHDYFMQEVTQGNDPPPLTLLIATKVKIDCVDRHLFSFWVVLFIYHFLERTDLRQGH
jgi:hypothetical protein